MISSDTHYQPFQVAWTRNTNGSYSVYCNKGWVHGFLKPERRVEVGDLVEILEQSDDPFSLTDGQFMYVEVTMEEEELRPNFRIGVPSNASIQIGTEVPITDANSPQKMYYEICRAEGSMIKQRLCSDIWAGWIDTESDSSSSVSEISESSSSSSSESSESDSSQSSIPPDESSSSSDSV